jgi:catechol 2,3-dioxygenase-like lactoylglutathione lyase family enzyme
MDGGTASQLIRSVRPTSLEHRAATKLRADMTSGPGGSMSEGDGQPEILRFDCVFYYVSDLDRAIAFYTNILGFRLASRDAVARFFIDGVLFELVPTTDPDVLSGQGNARFTLAVKRIETAVEELRAKGVAVSAIRAVSNGRLASLKDPDSNELVLWQYA